MQPLNEDFSKWLQFVDLLAKRRFPVFFLRRGERKSRRHFNKAVLGKQTIVAEFKKGPFSMNTGQFIEIGDDVIACCLADEATFEGDKAVKCRKRKLIKESVKNKIDIEWRRVSIIFHLMAKRSMQIQNEYPFLR